jgi:hypothetical protein
MGDKVHAEFVVTSRGIIRQGQELPDNLEDDELDHIKSTGALEEGGPPASDAVDAAYGTKSGSEEAYLGEDPPDPPEEEEPEQPPFETSDEAEEFYGQQGTAGDPYAVSTPEGGTRRPTPSPVVNQKGEEVPAPRPNLQGGQPQPRQKTKASQNKGQELESKGSSKESKPSSQQSAEK